MATILLIEPDAILAKTYGGAMEHAGHTVRFRTAAQSAISAADAEVPDVVIMEIQLVAHNGLEFLYEFRSYPDWLRIPVIILTNVPAGEFAGSWELLTNKLGVAAYLYKPRTSLKLLLQTVNRFVPVR